MLLAPAIQDVSIQTARPLPMSARGSCPDSLLLGERRPNADVTLSALLAPKPPLNRVNVARQIALYRIIGKRPRVQLRAMPTVPAFGFHGVTVPRIVADFVQPLAAHGFRRIDQTIADDADISAASADRMLESRTNMRSSESRKPTFVH